MEQNRGAFYTWRFAQIGAYSIQRSVTIFAFSVENARARIRALYKRALRYEDQQVDPEVHRYNNPFVLSLAGTWNDSMRGYLKDDFNEIVNSEPSIHSSNAMILVSYDDDA